jgi:hypothetical protein
MRWNWNRLVVYCLALVFVGWASSFLVNRFFVTGIGALIGFFADQNDWFDAQDIS